MMQRVFLSLVVIALTLIPVLNIHADQNPLNASLRQDEQLPGKMYTAMDERPRITVGQADADLIGSDNRALQAAVDYIAGLGGGTIQIGPGQYTMRDSLHLRPNVTVRGTKGKTTLRKADGVVSALAADGDFGEEQITVEDPSGFAVGYGVTILEDGASGFHITSARITGQRENVLAISKPLMSDCMVNSHARAATIFPVVSVYHAENVRIENLIIDGNKAGNVLLNGCRGAGIFLYQGHGATIQNCTVRGYNGDGISFQQSNDVTVADCISEHHTKLGLHPGSGSQRPTIRNCIARHNGTDGLFLCWRVKYGTFENNLMEQNGRFGISIGHKDSDNLFRHNTSRQNKQHGLFFRDETTPMAPHRNRFEQNIIENNGGAEIRIRGEVRDLVFENNMIRDARDQDTQSIGIQIEEKVGPVQLKNNTIETQVPVDDRRP
jgi:parallel beta-helix repeat protein